MYQKIHPITCKMATGIGDNVEKRLNHYTFKSCSNGFQGSDKSYLLMEEFFHSQHMKKKEAS